MKTVRIAILAYDGCMGTEVFGIADVLLMAGHVARSLRKIQQTSFDLQVIGLGGRTVTMAGGIPLGVKRPVGKFDLLIVPGPEISRRGEWDAKLANLSREIAYIQKTFAQGTSVASVCIGAFLLGEAGLIAGRKVTTSWLFAPDLASRYPAAKLSAAEILIEDGAVITTGAFSSAFDLGINIVKRNLGAQVATATARLALLPNQRPSQAPYVDSSLIGQRMPSFSHGVMQWLNDRLAETYDLERLALAFHVSVRTLLRRVKAETGQSPLTLLQQARVEKAKQLLGSTTWSIARVTEEIGYSDVATFSRLFAELVGETPAKYRRR
ncbi:MAG: helix-turn-helix domain-containing protein [Pseudomonadota bacterium]